MQLLTLAGVNFETITTLCRIKGERAVRVKVGASPALLQRQHGASRKRMQHLRLDAHWQGICGASRSAEHTANRRHCPCLALRRRRGSSAAGTPQLPTPR